MDVPTYKDVEEASEILKGVSNVTPVHTSRTLDKQLGVTCFIKCENFQRMGAFKFRGAFNAPSHLTPQQRQAGVVTTSSGNHAQAIALSASILNIKSTIVMPHDAPVSKVEATKECGGHIAKHDRHEEDGDEIALNIEKETGAVFISPFDDKYVISGQGTVGKELLEEMSDHGVSPDHLFVCIGGGGVTSGCCLAFEELAPHCKIIGVEPEAGNDAQQSLLAGRIVKIPTPKTTADGAQTKNIGELSCAIMSKRLQKIVTVTDDELVSCMGLFAQQLKIVVEPTGCLGLAGLKKMISCGEVKEGSNCGVIASGGNVDMTRCCELLQNGSF